jgi:glycosyltransferase involved in cell wall biosynthesis
MFLRSRTPQLATRGVSSGIRSDVARVDLVLPVLDEAAAIPWVLERIPPGVRPIVVDNASTDDSAAVALSFGATVVRESQRGFGAACYAGLREATADVVAFMDCDASLDPTQLVEVTGPVLAGRADLVLGARVPHLGAWPAHARAANRYLARRVSRRFGLRLTDLGPMRAVPREKLLGLGLADRRSGWPLEMVLRAAGAGWRIQEVPVPYLPRRGRSKVTGTLSGTIRAVRDQHRMLRSFS